MTRRRGVPHTHSAQPKLSSTLYDFLPSGEKLQKKPYQKLQLKWSCCRPLGNMFEAQKYDYPAYDKQFRLGPTLRLFHKVTKTTHQCYKQKITKSFLVEMLLEELFLNWRLLCENLIYGSRQQVNFELCGPIKVETIRFSSLVPLLHQRVYCEVCKNTTTRMKACQNINQIAIQ